MTMPRMIARHIHIDKRVVIGSYQRRKQAIEGDDNDHDHHQVMMMMMMVMMMMMMMS